MALAVADQNCANCFFSRVGTASEVIGGGTGTQVVTRRFCHLNPPIPLGDEVHHSLGWRTVADSDWCGYWSADASKNVVTVDLPGTIEGPPGAPGEQGVPGPTGAGLDTTAWSSFIPAVTPGAGAFTSVSAEVRYKQQGKSVDVGVRVTIVTNGSAATSIKLTSPPLTPQGTFAVLSGHNTQTWKAVVAYMDANFITIKHADGSYPGADAQTIALQGVIEVA